jgi:hypothetical protein
MSQRWREKISPKLVSLQKPPCKPIADHPLVTYRKNAAFLTLWQRQSPVIFPSHLQLAFVKRLATGHIQGWNTFSTESTSSFKSVHSIDGSTVLSSRRLVPFGLARKRSTFCLQFPPHKAKFVCSSTPFPYPQLVCKIVSQSSGRVLPHCLWCTRGHYFLSWRIPQGRSYSSDCKHCHVQTRTSQFIVDILWYLWRSQKTKLM